MKKLNQSNPSLNTKYLYLKSLNAEIDDPNDTFGEIQIEKNATKDASSEIIDNAGEARARAELATMQGESLVDLAQETAGQLATKPKRNKSEKGPKINTAGALESNDRADESLDIEMQKELDQVDSDTAEEVVQLGKERQEEATNRAINDVIEIPERPPGSPDSGEGMGSEAVEDNRTVV